MPGKLRPLKQTHAYLRARPPHGAAQHLATPRCPWHRRLPASTGPAAAAQYPRPPIESNCLESVYRSCTPEGMTCRCPTNEYYPCVFH